MAWLKQFPFRGTGGESSSGFGYWLHTLLPGSALDWKKQAGTLWKNGAVFCTLNWIGTSLNEAPMVAMRRRLDGEPEYLPEHPFSLLVARPNEFYGARSLWYGTVLSLLTDGNAYWLKVRNRQGTTPGELWYVPHWMMEPRWTRDGRSFITHYEYQVNGEILQVERSEVVHFRWGIDPENDRKGLGPLKAVLREIAGDNEASTYTASILRNMGVPGIVLGPGSADQAEISRENAEYVKTIIAARTTGDQRGMPIVVPVHYKLDTLGLSPEELALDKIWQFIESRVTAALQVPAQVVGLQVGHEQKTYANYQEARTAAWEDCLLPLMAALSETAWISVLSEFESSGGFNATFDTRGVRALQEDEDQRHKRARENFKVGIWTRAEARQETGREASAEDEVYFTDIQMSLAAVRGITEPAPAPKAVMSNGRKALGPADDQALGHLTWDERVMDELEALRRVPA